MSTGLLCGQGRVSEARSPEAPRQQPMGVGASVCLKSCLLHAESQCEQGYPTTKAAGVEVTMGTASLTVLPCHLESKGGFPFLLAKVD